MIVLPMDVLSTIPKKRFRDAGITLPPELSIVHREEDVTPYRESTCRAVLSLHSHFPSDDYLSMPKLEMVQLLSAGHDAIDVGRFAKRNIILCNNPGANADAVAEHILMSILYFARRVGECQAIDYTDAYTTQRNAMMGPLLRDARELHVGLIGMGQIGQAFAVMARALSISCSYTSRTRRIDIEEAHGATWRTLETLLKVCDVIALTLPLTPETVHFMNRARFAAMKDDAIFINVSRGALVDQEALADALRSRKLYGASTDVFDPEPPRPDNPLFQLPPDVRARLLLTPHLAGITHQTWREMMQRAISNLARYAVGKEPLHHVNDET
ncbi:2-hydroxyacid dehydrogenase [Ferroacidibacillus organovorans]|uniref:D-isomer specific 2-hydroxyacid dehydrogenase NAD-binding domain-containing protein n=1 Tax=Ferroacidibacillus organovorans TaxID=1765683 RepID=A0A1V4ESP6_9BACL|nr:D-isomer specific 2-hydroxyacid dehydrogenase family protein [Ferroacidibacillus organovorans]OPG15882.1 hypothetical protein B2M26_09770 [Ferroacidibacillus organovorans]